MISITLATSASDVVFVLLERTDTQQFFDWTVGTWVTSPTTYFAAQMSENGKLPGRMTYLAPHQALGQFTAGTPMVLWFFGNTGKMAPARAVVWSEGFVGALPPFTVAKPPMSFYVSEPTTAF